MRRLLCLRPKVSINWLLMDPRNGFRPALVTLERDRSSYHHTRSRLLRDVSFLTRTHATDTSQAMCQTVPALDRRASTTYPARERGSGGQGMDEREWLKCKEPQ